MATNQPRGWLITGASSGFGRAIAEAALAGDIVVAAARRADALADLVAFAPGCVTALALDVTDTDRIRAAVTEVLDRHGLRRRAGEQRRPRRHRRRGGDQRRRAPRPDGSALLRPGRTDPPLLPGMRERGTGALLLSKCIPAYDDQIEPLRTGMPDVEAADFAVTSSRSPAGGPDVQRFPEHPRVHLRPRWVNLEMLWGKR
jgi:hypothetical protein